MGYTTEFTGHFILDKSLDECQATYLKKFSQSRRMKRDVKIISCIPDDYRKAVDLEIGFQGEYFIGNTEKDDVSFSVDNGIIDYNKPPDTQPSLWCQWIPTTDNKGIKWDGTEKFYKYIEWLEYIINNFLKRWNHNLNGLVTWQGENKNDLGRISVVNNKISVHRG